MYKILIKVAIAGWIGITFIGSTQAQNNKVVVVPLAGDDTAQQNYSIAENTGSDDEGCVSSLFSTPNRATQVLSTSSGSMYSSVDDASWWAVSDYSKDFGAWTTFPPNQYTIARGPSFEWSFNSNTKALDLDPNSTYQFRVRYAGPPTHDNSICALVLQFSFKTEDVVSPFFFPLDPSQQGQDTREKAKPNEQLGVTIE